MFKCDDCPATVEETKTSGQWASVLKDEPGASPMIFCPKCAARIQKGWHEEQDETGKTVRFQRDYRSAMSRF